MKSQKQLNKYYVIIGGMGKTRFSELMKYRDEGTKKITLQNPDIISNEGK